MAQSQPSDIGFGYISQHNGSHDPQGIPVEIPQTPGSPLKSAMKTPGTPGRRIENLLSPTFREEQVLEKTEHETDKEQEKDLVCDIFELLSSSTNNITESQNPCTHGKICSSIRQLQLQSHRPLHAFHDLFHLQCHQGSASTKQSPSLGQWHQGVAPDHRPCSFLRLPRTMPRRLLELLEGRTSQGGEGRSLLHPFRRCILHLQHRHVGSRSWHSSELKE